MSPAVMEALRDVGGDGGGGGCCFLCRVQFSEIQEEGLVKERKITAKGIYRVRYTVQQYTEIQKNENTKYILYL